ncbi:MAG: endo alpha-1,4 polygalactosaminidase [Cellulomonas sp.]|nr:endo alpha-1,4 polygalactosaminidase [Cellulomonas sp.]
MAALIVVLATTAACTGPAGAGTADAPSGTPSPVATSAGPPEPPLAAPSAPDRRALPPGGVVVDYQLGGGYRPAPGIGGVVRDVTDVPEPGMWSGCYVNGFQTQPGERDTWLTEHPDLLLSDDAGAPVADPGWPDELLLDTSTAHKRAAITEVVGAQVRACAARGFDAVELDNLDSWTRSGGRLTANDALDLAARLVAVGHAAGLAVGQKNAAELGARGRDEAGYDFAVAEECAQYDECGAYTDVYGAAVIDVEYEPDGWAAACADPAQPVSTVLRDRELGTPDDDGYVLETC